MQMIGIKAPWILISGLEMTEFLIVIEDGDPSKRSTQLHFLNCKLSSAGCL